jgi:SAM-dependent methyltransferase
MTEWLHSKLIDESSSFCKSVVRHLEGNQAGLYSSSEAFSRFIDGGGNVPLYERAVDHAQQLITSEFGSDMTRMSLLDLGAGTGKLLIPLLSRLQHVKELRIVLVDAEEGMMKGLKEKVLECRPDADVVTLVANFVDFVNSEDEEFDVCISSFALHYCPVGDDRTMVLKWYTRTSSFFFFVCFSDHFLNKDLREC